MSRSVGQPLADRAQQRRLGAHGVVHAQPDPVVVAEIELGEVAVEVLLAAVLVDALHAPLGDREVAFRRVGVDVVADVLAGRVGRTVSWATT
jgi:hypothetical protein